MPKAESRSGLRVGLVIRNLGFVTEHQRLVIRAIRARFVIRDSRFVTGDQRLVIRVRCDSRSLCDS